MKRIWLILLFLTLPLFSASQNVQNAVQIQNPLNVTTFEGIINTFIDLLFWLAIILAPLMMICGGALYLTSQGEETKISQAKNLMTWTIVGFLIVLLAKGIMALMEEIIGID